MLIPQPGQLGASHPLTSVGNLALVPFSFLFWVAQEKCPVNFEVILIYKPFNDNLCSSIRFCANYKKASEGDSLRNILSPLCV